MHEMFKITTTVPEVYDLLKAGYLEPRVFQFAGKSFMPTECNVSAVAPQGRVFEIGYRLIEGAPIIWNGEGLPPIGLEVEVFSIAKPHHSYAAHVGQRVRIVAHDVLGEGDDEGLPVAVYAFNLSTGAGYHALVAGHFRPIRTAEQVAAEEREERIAYMVQVMYGKTGNSSKSDRAAAVALYDAGYRELKK